MNMSAGVPTYLPYLGAIADYMSTLARILYSGGGPAIQVPTMYGAVVAPRTGIISALSQMQWRTSCDVER